MFALQGYPATTHKQIVSRAGVSTAVLWRNFGSKSRLLLEVVIEPFGAVVRDMAEAVAHAGSRGGEDLSEAFVADLYRRLTPHDQNLRALLTALQSPDGDELMAEFGKRLDALFDELHPQLAADSASADQARTADIGLRVIVGTVTAVVVLHEWFFTAEQIDQPARIIEVLGSMCPYGRRIDWPSPADITVARDDLEVDAAAEPPAPVPALPDGRQRRGSSDVRQALLTSATNLFSTSGFSATSYRDIAQVAGTSESALYRHFGSKSNLLVEGVLKPFTDAFDSATRRWARMPPDSRRDRQIQLVSELYVSLRSHRQLLRVLMGLSHDPQHPQLHATVTAWFADALEELHLLTRERVRHETDLTAEPDLRLRAFMAMALATTALDDWFFSPGTDAAPGDVVAVISHLVSLGRRPPRA